MVNSAQVPSNFKITWKQQSPASRKLTPSNGIRSSSKLCSACDACRNSRVKCSGGQPCRRCDANGEERCHYSVSLRNGRVKARREERARDSTKETDESVTADMDVEFPAPGFEDDLASTETFSKPGSTADLFDFSVSNLSTTPSTMASLQGGLGAAGAPSPFSGSTPSDFTSSIDLSLFNPPPEMDSEFSLSLPPSLNQSIPDPFSALFDQAALGSFASPSNPSSGEAVCSCTANQLAHLSQLYSTPRTISFPEMLSTGRSTAALLETQFSCAHCASDRCSTHFLLAVIALQRILNHFCGLSHRGHAYLRATRPLGLTCPHLSGAGTVEFALEPDEDRGVKRGLVLETLRRLQHVVATVGAAERRISHAAETETRGSNLVWVRDALALLKVRVERCFEQVEKEDWGTGPEGDVAAPEACT